MLNFDKLQVRVVRYIRRKKKELNKLIIFLNIIILAITLRHIFFNSKKIIYKVATDPPIIDSTIEDFRIKETQDFLINTPGCYIPNYAKTFKYKRSVKEFTNINDMCGVRYIFIDIIKDDKIKFRMHKFTEKGITCCYQYISESTTPGHKTDQLSYTPCEVFTNNSKAWLMQEVITVTCTKQKKYIYKDAYIILKKSNEKNEQSELDNKMRWNVLMIGLDGMSRTRAFDTMPRTTKYLKDHKWLDFKAYQKVENNTFQNLMSVLTGKRMSSIYSNCTSDLNKCADDYFIWKQYKDAGYKTAYGESNLQSETFSSGFKTSPTDHYMRPSLFSRTSCSGEILCTGKKPSATHLLEYALNFVDSYKTNSFFGMFWINTYASYNNTPELSDTEFLNFFEKLNNSEALNNTFVIFFSDQGTSFGEMRFLMESHYDNQLPMLFLWTPVEFRRNYINKHYNLQVNQERLITPYDVYITLADILKISINSTEKKQSEGCPECTTLLDKLSPNRTCADAGVGEYCCSCHNLSKIDTDIERVDNSISLIKEHLQKIRSSIETLPCTSCKKFKYLTIIRAHEYYQDEKKYFVIAFHMSPSELNFEVLVEHYGVRFRVLSLRTMTRYNDMGNCALHNQDRPFCVCAFDTSCLPKSIIKNVTDYLDPSYMKVIGPKSFDEVINSVIMSL